MSVIIDKVLQLADLASVRKQPIVFRTNQGENLISVLVEGAVLEDAYLLINPMAAGFDDDSDGDSAWIESGSIGTRLNKSNIAEIGWPTNQFEALFWVQVLYSPEDWEGIFNAEDMLWIESRKETLIDGLRRKPNTTPAAASPAIEPATEMEYPAEELWGFDLTAENVIGKVISPYQSKSTH